MRLLLDDGDRPFIGDEGGEIRMWQPLAMMYLVSTGSRALSWKTSSRSTTYHEAVVLEKSLAGSDQRYLGSTQEGTTITRSLHEGTSKKLPGTLKALINPNAAGTGLLDLQPVSYIHAHTIEFRCAHLLVASLAERDIAQARLTHSGLNFHLVQKRSMA